jgi:hypothetical protein
MKVENLVTFFLERMDYTDTSNRPVTSTWNIFSKTGNKTVLDWECEISMDHCAFIKDI